MPNLTFTFDTGTVTVKRIVDAIADNNSYQPTINGAANPQTKAQFAKECIRAYIVSNVRNYERSQAAATATAAVADVTLT